MTPRRFVLGLLVFYFALSVDRALPEPRLKPKPEPTRVESVRHALDRIAGRNQGRLGRPGNALNLVFVGSESSVRGAMISAGWTEVPRTIRESVAAGLSELMTGRTLAAAPPMNDYWLDGRRQDMNWALPTKPIIARHHFRLWDTGLRDPAGRALWWGSGDYDFAVRWHDLSHVPDPDMNAERDYIAAALKSVGAARRVTYEALAQIPRAYANDKGYAFRNDGRVAVIEVD